MMRTNSIGQIAQSVPHSRLLYELFLLPETFCGSNPSLSRSLAKDRSSITRALKKLEKAGFIEEISGDHKYNRRYFKISYRKIAAYLEVPVNKSHRGLGQLLRPMRYGYTLEEIRMMLKAVKIIGLSSLADTLSEPVEAGSVSGDTEPEVGSN